MRLNFQVGSSMPNERYLRSKQLQEAREAAAKALCRADSLSVTADPAERVAILDKCREALQDLLLISASPRQLRELTDIHPGLVQPGLFSAWSPSSK